MSKRWVNALGIAAVAVSVTLVIFLSLDISGSFEVHQDIINTLVGVMSACGVSYAAAKCRDDIIARIDEHGSQATAATVGQQEVREALAGFAEAVTEYGDSRVAEDRISDLRDLAKKLPPVNGYDQIRLKSVGQ